MQHGSMNGEIAHLIKGLNAPFSAVEQARQTARDALIPRDILRGPETHRQQADRREAVRRSPEESWDNEGGSQVPAARPAREAGVGAV